MQPQIVMRPCFRNVFRLFFILFYLLTHTHSHTKSPVSCHGHWCLTSCPLPLHQYLCVTSDLGTVSVRCIHQKMCEVVKPQLGAEYTTDLLALMKNRNRMDLALTWVCETGYVLSFGWMWCSCSNNWGCACLNRIPARRWCNILWSFVGFKPCLAVIHNLGASCPNA